MSSAKRKQRIELLVKCDEEYRRQVELLRVIGESCDVTLDQAAAAFGILIFKGNENSEDRKDV